MRKTSVTLRTKKIKNGMLSIYLDYYPPVVIPTTAKLSRREFLKIKIYEFPENTLQNRHNESQLDLAEEIRAQRFLQLRNREFGLPENIEHNVNFHKYFSSVVEEYYNEGSRSNYQVWKVCLKHWESFAGTDLQSRQLTIWHVKEYRNYLLTTKTRRSDSKKLSNNTAGTYYKNFIIVLKKAFKDKILITNLAADAKHIKEQRNTRVYLSEDELTLLWKTPIDEPKVKHMAMFSALTGLRFSDVITLKWEDVFKDKHQGVYIQLTHQKTDKRQSHPISNLAHDILNKQSTQTGLVFQDIKYYQVVRYLKKWIDDSKIQKKVTFHSFRHTYATLQIANNTNIYVIKEMLGHASISTTEIYLHSLDRDKIKAANSINIDLDGL